ncbi:MAG: xylulokinase, partial [Candidatus Bathyarchaeia archaeon]
MWTYRNYMGEKVTIQDITDRYVEVDENTLVFPKPDNVKIYRELQKIQDALSRSLRRVFHLHRRFLEKYVR